jgi:hypothetical protein
MLDAAGEDTAMFAPRVAKPQATKAEPTSAFARQRLTLVAHRSLRGLATDSNARAASWDFSKIPVFSPDRASRPPLSSLHAASPSFGAIQAKLVVGEVNDPL